MTELLTAAQMRAIEQAAIGSGEVTGLELMERAGQGVVETILEWRPELATAPHRAVVLCGPGNNGGDGFVVARLLKQRGWEVEVFLYGDEAKLPPDAAENARRWREMGEIAPLVEGALDDAVHRSFRFLDVRQVDGPDGVQFERTSASIETIFVDALFGTGLSRPLSADLSEILRMEWGDDCWQTGVAIDIPTGICSDSAMTFKDCGYALSKLVVTFHRPKTGHHLGWWQYDYPKLVCVDLGLDDYAYSDGFSLRQDSGNAAEDGIALGKHWTTERDRYATLSSRSETVFAFNNWSSRKTPDRHKYAHGHAFILSGGPGKGGAARLAARGALRIGTGLVTVGCPQEALIEHAARLDAVMLAPVSDADGLLAGLQDRKVNAVCIGPGFGLGERLRTFIKGALESHPTRDGGRLGVVLDADALTEFRDDPETLFGMLHKGCVLTPHEGEFGRLFPDILAKLKEPATTGPAYSKVDAAREAAKRAGCVVLFKGADTVIAHPDERCSVNSAHYDRAAPWLATAGSGDVLAGFITGLLARGFDPMSAAETAAWLHVECALKFGPGLIAEDIPEQLPAVFRDLGM